MKDRIQQFIEHLGISVSEFERNCRMSNGSVMKMGTGTRKSTIDKISSTYPDLNLLWLKEGIGEMLNSSSAYQENSTNPSNDKSFCLVPVVPTLASAGHLSDFTDSVKNYDCEMMISPIEDATLAMAVYGDSMFPEYPSGSRVLLKKVNEKAFIEWGKVYVLDTENGAVIKEIHHCEDEEYIECVSQNPDPKYAPFRIPKNSIFGWYKVIMVLSHK